MLDVANALLADGICSKKVFGARPRRSRNVRHEVLGARERGRRSYHLDARFHLRPAGRVNTLCALMHLSWIHEDGDPEQGGDEGRGEGSQQGFGPPGPAQGPEGPGGAEGDRGRGVGSREAS